MGPSGHGNGYENTYRKLFDASFDALFVFDSSGRIIDANHVAERRYGYSREQLLGLTVFDLVPERLHPQVPARLAAVAKGALQFEGIHRRRDGTEVKTEVRATATEIDGQRLVFSTVRDLSERDESHARIRRLGRTRALLSGVSRTIVRERDLVGLCTAVCRIAVEHGGFPLVWIGVLDRPDGRVVPTARAGSAVAYLDRVGLLEDSGSADELVQQALSDRSPVILNDVGRDERTATWREAAQASGLRSAAAFPMLVRGEARAAFALYSEEPGFFDDEEVELLSDLAMDLSFALEVNEDERLRATAERALRDREDDLERAEQMARIGHWSRALDTTFVRMSNEACRLIGVDPHAGGAEQKTLFACVHPEDRATLLDALGDWTTAATCQVEFRVVHDDGVVRAIQLTGEIEQDAEGRPVRRFGTVQDITERRDLIAALRDGEETYRALVEGLPDVIMRFDRQGRHLYVSNNVTEVVDLAPDRFLGKTHRELGFPAAQSAFWEEAIQRVFHTGTGVETEFAFESKGRQAVFNWRLLPEFDAQGATRTVLSISRDVTAHRRAERDYQTLFREMLDGFALHELICDDAGNPVDYRFLAVNPAFERMTGLAAEQIVGKTIMTVMPGVERHWIETYGRVTRTGAPAFFDNYSRELDRHFQVSAYRPAPGQFACIFTDVSERVRSETTRSQLQEQLFQAQKMESVGRLAGGVAHDFNNLLSVINGYASFAASELREGDPLRADIEEIQLAGERAAALTRQLLAFSRKQVMKPEALDLNAIVREMDKMLRRLIGEDIDLSIALSPDLDRVMADAGQVEQVLMNLVVNARDAMPSGGTLTIETANTPLDDARARRHGDSMAGRYVMLAVTDSGVGMDADVKEHIFEPFFSTKGAGRGTGLGLSTVYGIVKQSGGHILAKSEPGHGTSMQVYLPRSTLDAADRPRKSDASELRGTETILVVEDEQAVRDVTRRILASAGYKVLTAPNGGEALLLCERRGEVNLVLTDVVMPHMTGKQLTERLAVVCPGLKVLYMSGYTDDAIVHHGVLDPGVHLIGKPFNAASLLAMVRQVLDGMR